MRTRRIIPFVVVLLLAALAVPSVAAGDQADQHCPGAQDEQSNVYVELPAGYTVVSRTEVPDTFGPTLTLEPGTYFCVKAGNWASGILTMGVSGSYTTPTDVTPSPHPVGISYYMVYDFTPPPTVDITLAKGWFDVQGQPVTTPPGTGWQLRMTVSADGINDTVVATLPGTATASFQPQPIARYGVQETVPTGWRTVACSTVTAGALGLSNVVSYDTSTIEAARNPEGGAFAATTTGLHLVCNQQVPTVTPDEPIPTPTPTPSPTPPVVPPVTPPITPPEPPVTPPEPPSEVLPEIIEPEPEVVPEVAPVETEVLDVVLEKPAAAAPTRVDAGSGGLARTGVPTLVFALMGAGLVLVGGSTLAAARKR
jgi:hypothetical protein